MTDNGDLDIGVDFGTVSVGKKGARIGVKIPRSRISFERAEEFFCGSKLHVNLLLDADSRDDLEGQKTLDMGEGNTELRIRGSVEVKSFKVSTNDIAVSLGFDENVEATDLVEFVSGSGRLMAKLAGVADDDGNDGDDDDDGEDD